MIEVIEKIKKVLDIRDFKIILEKESKNKIYFYCLDFMIIYSPENSSITVAFNVNMKADVAVLLTLHLQSELTNFADSIHILESFIYDENLNYLTGEIAYQKLEHFKKNSSIKDYIMKEQENHIINHGKAFNC